MQENKNCQVKTRAKNIPRFLTRLGEGGLLLASRSCDEMICEIRDKTAVIFYLKKLKSNSNTTTTLSQLTRVKLLNGSNQAVALHTHAAL